MMPKREEPRMFSAQILSFRRKNQKLLEVFKPLKDKYPLHYKYYEAYQNEKIDDKKFVMALIGILKEAEKREVNIPPTSKYRLLDLKNIFIFISYY